MENKQKIYRRNRLNQRGYGGLIIAVLFLSTVMFYLSVPLFLQSSIALKDANLRVARRYSEETAIATSGPIADDVQKQVVTLVQESLFDRIAKAKSGVTYTCQDGSTSGEAALSNTFAICDPVGVLDEMEGAQNQFMNDINAFLPNLGAHANEPQYQAMKRYLTNDYSYTLSPVFVSKKLVDPGNRQITSKIGINKSPLQLPRIEQYRFLVRADITMHTYDKVTWRLFANYDVILETEFHNNGKSGGFADSCDASKNNFQVNIVLPTLTNSDVGPGGVPVNCYDVGGPEGYSTCGVVGAYDPSGNYIPPGDLQLSNVCPTNDCQTKYENGQLPCTENNGLTLCDGGNGYLFSPRPVSRVRKSPGMACVGENTSKSRLGDIFRLPSPASQVTGSTPNDQRFTGKTFPTGTLAAAKDNKSTYGYQFKTITKLVAVGNYYN